MQVEFPLYEGIGWQHVGVLDAIAQVDGSTESHFLRKFMVPAAKSVGVDLT